MTSNLIYISIIVPVYNNSRNLLECLSALKASSYPNSEIIVVDDGSTDDTPYVAPRMGVRVLRLPKNSGPAPARNYGAHHAQGEILLFVDSDVIVPPEAINHLVKVFEEHPDVAAVFGSYDDLPRANNVVSQYRNLLHNFIHQNGNPEASTFWAGCGAIRRSVFEAIGGFEISDRFPKCSIEDIALGYRLRQAGYRILLDKALQVTHLKRWTLSSIIRTDIIYRAIPWSRLIMETQQAPYDLNLKRVQRLSGVLVILAFFLLLLSLFQIKLLVIAAAALLCVVILNRKLYAFFFRKRGLLFAAACIPLHLLYYFYSGLSYIYVWMDVQLRGSVTGRDHHIK